MNIIHMSVSGNIHLHLGVKDIKTNTYENPEKIFALYIPPEKYSPGTYKVTANILNVRSGAGTAYRIKRFNEFSENAKAQIKKLSGKNINGYVLNIVCTVTSVSENWGKTPSGWICLDYCKKV